MANISILVILFLFLSFRPSVISLPLSSITSSNQTQVYIVHVEHPTGPAHLLHPTDRDAWYHSFLPNATLDSGEPRMVYTYSAAMSGFAAFLTPAEAEAMSSIPGFLYARPDDTLTLRTTHTPALLGLDQYNSLWQHTDQGEGIIIGVIDSGITPDHVSFADPGLPEPPLKWRGRCILPSTSAASCSNKLIGAQVFAHKGTTSSLDETGHGTHVSGIAAGTPVNDANLLGQGRGTATGMAPRAHIASYKTCSPSSCKDSNSIKGFDQAITDGVDLVQTSLGNPHAEYHSNGVVVGSYAALSHGILTVNSAGNDGPTKSILDNDAPWILHVGAANIDRTVTAVLKLGNGMEFLGMSAYQPDPSNVVNLPLAYPGLKGGPDKLHCKEGSLAGEDLAGKIVLCRVGLISGIWKAKIVKKAGGAGMVLLNTPSEGDTLSAVPYDIPAVLVSYNDAVKILNYFSIDKNPTGTISFRGTNYGFRPSPTVASFSSRGPSMRNGGILKPDVIAPGVNILSAYPMQVGPDNTTTYRQVYANQKRWFVFYTGTSMAAPHVSGVVALLKKVHPDWSPASIKSAIMTTATILDRDGRPITDDASNSRNAANVFAIGAGHIDPSAARDPGLVYNASAEDYIPYLCGLKGYTSKEVKIIVNRPLNCKEKKAAEELNYPAIQVYLGAIGAANKTVQRTVTNVGEATSTYTATVVEPSGVMVKVKPKTLQFKSIGEEQSFVVELSLTGKKSSEKDKVMEGRLKWVSGKRQVSSPIVAVT